MPARNKASVTEIAVFASDDQRSLITASQREQDIGEGVKPSAHDQISSSRLLRQATVAIAQASVALTTMMVRNRVGILTSTAGIMAGNVQSAWIWLRARKKPKQTSCLG